MGWNDLNSLTEVFTHSGSQIAGVLMEPVMVNGGVATPQPGYLQGAIQLCREHGSLFLCDEVITGFRLGLRGAQGLFGVTPDLTILAKAVAAGFPLAVVGGRREVMDRLLNGNVMHGGTYNGNVQSAVAALAALDELSRDGGAVYRDMERQGMRLMDGLRALGRKHRVPMLVQGYPQIFQTFFMDGPGPCNYRDVAVRNDRDRALAFSRALQEEGVRVNQRCAWFLSTAHDRDAIDETSGRRRPGDGGPVAIVGLQTGLASAVRSAQAHQAKGWTSVAGELEVKLRAPWRVGVDVGGTFTDLVAQDADGRMVVAKVPSVPADPSQGVLAAVTDAADQAGLSGHDFLAGCNGFVHGSTIATNTLLEGKGARVGMLTTKGFRDSIEIRRGLRENQWDHRTPFPLVLVPRYLRLPVRGRIAADGSEIAPIELGDVASAVAVFREEGVKSVAICLINSFANPAHERAVAQAVRAANNAWPVSVSSDVMPIIGEYERGSTTVVNAYVAPRVVPYLRALDATLQRLGLPGGLLLVQSNGGIASVAQLENRPVSLALSGPAGGVGALKLFGRAVGTGDLLSMEIGGTSCDVMLMSAGEVATTDQLMVAGYHLSTPAIDIHTVGAGGGTIAGVDSGGMLFVGPRGAGARPGPASYGFGNTEPTVTDALLVLGRLRPGSYAGGAVSLKPELGRAALKSVIGNKIGLSEEQSAVGIIRLLEQNLLNAVERISLERGIDPRKFTLVAAGGAGPMHGASVGRALGCRRVYVPRVAGAFCALGMLHTDVQQDWVRVFASEVETVSVETLARPFEEMEVEARRMLQAEGFPPTRQRVVRALDLQYPGQQSSLRVDIDGTFDSAAVRSRFEAHHQRLFGHIQPGGRIAIVGLRVAGIGQVEAREPQAPAPGQGTPVSRGARRAYVDETYGWMSAQIYTGADLGPGHRLMGPAIIEEMTTTVFVGARDTLTVDAAGNFDIAFAP